MRVNDSTWKLKKKKALGGARTHLCCVRALSSTNLLSIQFHAGLEKLYNFITVIMCHLLLFILSWFLLLYFHSRFHYCNTIAILDPLVSSPLSANYCSNSFKQIKHCTQWKWVCICILGKVLTEVAGEGGIDWAPQKFLSSQQFRHLMRCSRHEYCNLTKFHQNWIKNKNFLFLGHFL